MTPSSVVWEDPPPARFRWAPKVRELRENPGHWARVIGPTTDYAEAMRGCKAMEHHACEYRMRKLSGVGWAVWARWKPQESLHPEPT